MVCGGVGKFKLHVLDDDERSSVSVVAPDGEIFPLEYWEVVTHSFSSLGAGAEWRVASMRCFRTLGSKREAWLMAKAPFV